MNDPVHFFFLPRMQRFNEGLSPLIFGLIMLYDYCVDYPVLFSPKHLNLVIVKVIVFSLFPQMDVH